FEEFAARAAAINLTMRDSGKFQLSAGEYREIARLHASVFGLLSSGPFHLFGGDEETPAQIEQFESSVKGFLGETRFAEYQREKDDDFRNVRSVTEENQLAREAAVKVYEIKQWVKAERTRLEALAAGPEREAQWRQVQETTHTQVRRLLGDKAFGLYLNRGGQWLTNFPNL
ncbi:MAG TPA: hypothetical protein VNT26_07810, partial [Candidatus Sulfotelmatobacter sp.]|nr:hypothetical protein [Candidatus Sulfotelmatobacter sp.]